MKRLVRSLFAKAPIWAKQFRRDPAAHNDYRTVATVDLSALGEVDTATSNDDCPRPPSGSDPGCGSKTAAGTLGADVLTDVVVK